MADQETTGELRKATEITDDEINAAVDVVLTKPETTGFKLGAYSLDFAAAVGAHGPSAKALADPEAKAGWRRTMARTAILMARPEKS